mgnify:CR=1 FL=1
MYLTRVNPKDGLLFIEDGEDGILCIKEFRDLVNDKKYGLMCLTAVALTADYQSKINFYDDKDRPRKAQEEVTGNRDYWEWKSEPIQKALKKYEALQFDPTLEEKRIYDIQKVLKLREMENYPDLSEDEKKKTSMVQLRKDMRLINQDIAELEKRTENKDIYSNSPVVNDYELSRLEQKLESKNSFYHKIR